METEGWKDTLVAAAEKIQIVGPRFLAVRVEPRIVTEGGIFLPEKTIEKSQFQQPEFLVVRVSETLKRTLTEDLHIDLPPQSRVLLSPTCGNQMISVDGLSLFLVDWASVRGVYKELL
jgi:co-chaperonin GroES (HSP10)